MRRRHERGARGRPHEGTNGVTAERDGKSGRTGQPDLLASLPAEGPPASRPDPGIDPAAIEELLTEVRNLREQVAGLREAVSTERSAPEPAAVPEALTLEALESWGDGPSWPVSSRLREPRTRQGTRRGTRRGTTRRRPSRTIPAGSRKRRRRRQRRQNASIGVWKPPADRVTAEIEGAVTRIETGLAATRSQVIQQSRQADPILEDIHARKRPG